MLKMEGLRNYCNGLARGVAQRVAQTEAYQYYDQKCQDWVGKSGETVLQITGVATSALMILGLAYMTPVGTGIDLVVGTLPVGHHFVVGSCEVIKLVLELVFKDLLGGVAHFIFSDVIGGGLGVIGQAIGILGSLVSVSFQGAVTAAIIAALVFGYRVDNFFNAPAPEPLPAVAVGEAPLEDAEEVPLPVHQAPFNPAPYPGGDRFNIHHARWYYVEAREMARSAYRNGLQGIQFVRYHMGDKPKVKYAVYGILGVTAATYAIAMAAISLTIIAGLVRATANFIGTVMYSGYTFIKGCVQAIWNCCKAVVNVALDVMAAFWNTIKVPFCIVRDGVYAVGSATYNSVLKPTGAATIHLGKAIGRGMYSAGVMVKNGVSSLARRVSPFQGVPKLVDLFPTKKALIPQG
jgi:hypothetical protein